MRSTSCIVRRCRRLFAGALLAATAAQATSYVAIDDRALYDQAAAVAQVHVLSAGPAPAVGSPAVDYIVLVERLLKGQIAGSTVVVRVAGGVGPDGWGIELVGAPRFAAGDRALLFLVPRNDGTYGILHLMLGAFHEIDFGRHRLAVRDLLEDGTSQPAPRDFERFADWLAAGAPAGADYRVAVDAATLGRWRRAFGVVRFEQRRLRWFEDQVEWRLGRKAPTRIRRWLKEALRAWSPVSGLRLGYGGRTDAVAGLHRFDSVNAVILGDRDDLIPGRFDCRAGGVLAAGAPWFDPQITGKQVPGGVHSPAIRILGADILLNDGAECLLDGLETLGVDALLHELGHTLGLGVRCGDAVQGPCGDGDGSPVMGAMLRPDRRHLPPGDAERDDLQDRR